MSNKKRNSYSYTKSGRRRPGVFCGMINTTTDREDPAKQDRENRKEALDKINKLVENGMDLDKAVSIIAEDQEVKEKFSYLTKHGIDIKPMLKNVYLSSKSEDRKYYPHSNERGER